MQVAVITSNPAGIYSGGRYLSLIMAYSLARAGAAVTYATDNLPMFDADFAPLEAQFPIRKLVDKSFSFSDLGPLDWVVVIPTGGISDVIYASAAQCATASGARIALLSFETPNWFNALAPNKRSGLAWEAWRKCVAKGGLVLTIAREGIAPARAFYGSPHHRARLEYAFWHPPINDLVADATEPAAETRNRVVAFVRTQDAHKGAADLLHLDPEVLRGRILSVVFGRSVEQPYLDALKRHFSHAGVVIEAHDRISDREKFALLAKARLLLFPSYFEGFGYPVVEAAYMGVPSVSYDLPVVRETVGGAALYVAPGDHADFSGAIAQALRTEPGPDVRAKLRIDPDTQNAGFKLDRILRTNMRLIAPLSKAPAPYPVECPERQDVLGEPEVRDLLASTRNEVRLHDLVAVVSHDTLTISGRQADKKPADARIRINFCEGPQSEHALKASRNFEIRRPIGRLPTSRLVCRLEVLGASPAVSQEVAIRIAPTTLFCADAWAGSPNCMPLGAGGERVLLLAELSRILECNRETLAFSELAARFRAMGFPVTLLLDTHAKSVPLSEIDLDLLPLVDAVEVVKRNDFSQIYRNCLSATTPITLVASSDFLPEAAAQADVVLDLGGAEAPIICARMPQRSIRDGARIVYKPSRLSSRQEVRKQAGCIIVVGAAPSADAGPSWKKLFCEVLPLVTVRFPNVRIVVHSSLIADSKDQLAASAFTAQSGCPVIVGDFGQIQAHLHEAAHAILLDIGEGDADGRLLALSIGQGSRILRLNAATSNEELVETICADIGRAAKVDGSEIEAELSRTWSSAVVGAVPQHAIARMTIDAASEAGAGGGRRLIHVPSLEIGQTFALSAQSDVVTDFLVTGWSKCGVDGSTIAASGAMIAFNLIRPVLTAVVVEMLFRSSAPKNKPITCDVFLNGNLIGNAALNRAGAHAVSFQVAGRLWRTKGPQVITFRPEPVTIDDAIYTPSLVAVALLKYPNEPDWKEFDRDKPIVDLAPLQGLSGYPRRLNFRTDTGDQVFLCRGWGTMETGFVWSIDRSASIVIGAEAVASSPLMLTLEAGALLTESHSSQRVRVEAGGQEIGELRTGVASPTRYAFAVPPSVAELGLEGVVMHFPDSVRPKDLGISADSRLLGLSLQELVVETPAGVPRTCRVEQTGPAGPEGPVTVEDFRHASAVIRLTGSGSIPGVIVVGLPRRLVRTRIAIAEGRWEAWAALSDVGTMSSGLRVEYEPDENAMLHEVPVLERVEVWPVGDERAAPVDLTVQFRFSVPLSLRLSQPSATLSFGTETDEAVLTEGWSIAEQSFRWSHADTAKIDLSAAKPGGRFVLLKLDLAPFLSRGVPRQTVILSADGTEFGRACLSVSDVTSVLFVLEHEGGSLGSIGLRLPNAISPESLGLSADVRRLGVRLYGLSIEGADPTDDVAVLARKDGWTVSSLEATPATVIVRIDGPGEGGPAHFGVRGSGIYATARIDAGRASAVLAVPREALAGGAAILRGVEPPGGDGGLVEGEVVAEIGPLARDERMRASG